MSSKAKGESEMERPECVSVGDERPYFAIAGELVSDFIAFGKIVEALRPEIAAIPGTFLMTVSACDGHVLLGKQQPGGRVVVVECVLADPNRMATFGQSDLPIAIDPDAPKH